MNIVEIAHLTALAGRRIMEIYDDKALANQVAWKADASPLTLADRVAHGVLTEGLLKLHPHIPVLSEEGRDIPFSERKGWQRYWCVDPLDGTREFVNRNGEFTVNVALIEDGYPQLGVIHVPVTQTTYLASAEYGAWKWLEGEVPQKLQVRSLPTGWTALCSRSHALPEEEVFLRGYPVVDRKTVGSAVKFGLIAEGKAQIYYRQGPTMEWDTAAGHAIINYSGGSLTRPDGRSFLYNKESLQNESFLCLATPENNGLSPY
ncbi:3'(2'),5'-bisphosphate nucleotidase CysQ [Dyadobacter tibetensis]|uniref:3'(2'),5'-bisphosphate nucleotidase CysQ n=1 Tax=Dyadobacter tibetensis TaxID=1211851 RepID=UPI0004B5389C|nr:3'(2'),5'-bisphosphate nucleotidase CysQ [Dyadobacter tibetensis]